MAHPELRYVLRIWEKNVQADIALTKSDGDALHIGEKLNSYFFTGPGQFDASAFTSLQPDSDGYIRHNNAVDHLSTAFYLINSLQEYSGQGHDNLGRYMYINSLQHQRGNVTENVVQKCFDEISKVAGIKKKEKKSAFFLTHDIDIIHGAILEDGFNVLKKGRIDQFLKLLFNVAMGRPDWLNIDKIMAIESEYDCKSVFYWLVNKGIINKRERNSDYVFGSPKIQHAFRQVESKGFENGLHKSISAESFENELKKFGRLPLGNRYHYLKFSLPRAYHDIENAGLQLDASLGFAEEIGFRNSYGLPFNPYNMTERKPFSFIEAPLHIMDRTFFQYQKLDVIAAERKIFDFFEKNMNDCVFSILWHNNFFTNYKFKGYLGLYKNVLAFIRDNNFKTLSQHEIIKNYSIVN
jgi:hypothetical protein